MNIYTINKLFRIIMTSLLSFEKKIQTCVYVCVCVCVLNLYYFVGGENLLLYHRKEKDIRKKLFSKKNTGQYKS